MIIKTDKYYLFWKSDSKLSNWAYTPIVYDSFKINYTEIALMYEKAILFNDMKMADKIINSKHPKEAKRLGRLVKNFDNRIWNDNRELISFKVLLNKIQQSNKTYHEVKNNKHLYFVEASPYDKIWGIGLAPDDPRAKDKSQWQGLNLLGKSWDRVNNYVF